MRPVPRDCVLVFVRAPEAGRVKTRLAARLGPDAALRVYRRLAEHALAQARALGPDVEVRVHFTPADAEAAVRSWLGEGVTYLPQLDSPDLGARMHEAFMEAFEDGFTRVVVVGSDLPELSADLLRRALDLVDRHRVVIGPARDGGYWLLGMREMVGPVFHGVPWSTGRVLARTLEILEGMGIAPALLEELADVDEAGDLPPGWG